MNIRRLIVSRHAAAIEFIWSQPDWAEAPVLSSAAPDDVRGAVVAGNIPLHLAALAAEVAALEFTGPPPRGEEYGLPEMIAAGARLRRYRVLALSEEQSDLSWSDELGSRSRAAHLVLRKGDSLVRFRGESIPGVVAVTGRGYSNNGKWSHTTYRLRLAAGVAIAFNGHSGWETGTIMESLSADSWECLGVSLGVPDTPGFREFILSWRPSDATELDRREAAVAGLEQVI